GIRDFHVTGVQTCALPIFMPKTCAVIESMAPLSTTELTEKTKEIKSSAIFARERKIFAWGPLDEIYKIIPENEIKSCEEYDLSRSEERRVGKEWRSRRLQS